MGLERIFDVAGLYIELIIVDIGLGIIMLLGIVLGIMLGIAVDIELGNEVDNSVGVTLGSGLAIALGIVLCIVLVIVFGIALFGVTTGMGRGIMLLLGIAGNIGNDDRLLKGFPSLIPFIITGLQLCGIVCENGLKF